MSKTRKKKKKPVADNQKSTKKLHKKRIVTVVTIAVLIAAVITVAFISKSCYDSSSNAQLVSSTWVPTSAKNSTGDEVELSEVYKNNYSNYQGSLTFSKDGTFSLWLTPGTPDDGTHSGTYEVVDDGTIKAVFDEGTQTVFKINRDNNQVNSIVMNYDEYSVCFTKQQ